MFAAQTGSTEEDALGDNLVSERLEALPALSGGPKAVSRRLYCDENPGVPAEAACEVGHLMFVNLGRGVRDLVSDKGQLLAMHSAVTSGVRSVVAVIFSAPPPEVGLTHIVLSFAGWRNANLGWFDLPV